MPVEPLYHQGASLPVITNTCHFRVLQAERSENNRVVISVGAHS